LLPVGAGEGGVGSWMRDSVDGRDWGDDVGAGMADLVADEHCYGLPWAAAADEFANHVGLVQLESSLFPYYAPLFEEE
jgi:hypothetical protein